ncbi:hypothetical protein [Lederbergia lenta]|uniref:hypothetical protein n=1 Tax=Lederbergia lenta TaxID=1467 RepID=UPI00203E2117|nr:hypothetical protein [Lederbergia lenta]MCM3112820.1 hypothetical protein [Lederbergia lenta]
MSKVEIPERFKSMSTEEVIKKIYKYIEKKEMLEIDTRRLAFEAITMTIESNKKLTKELRAADEKYNRLLEEKGNEYKKLIGIIEKTNDNLYDIAMECTKRIEALENLKRLKNCIKEENENASIDFAIDEHLNLLQFIEYRLIPIPIS